MKFSQGFSVLAIGFVASCDSGPSGDAPPPAQNLIFNVGPSLGPKVNQAGWSRTASVTGDVDHANPFFQSLGTNDRACVTCHQVGEGWTITPAGVQLRFLVSEGTDPLFRPHDAANAPLLDVSTVDARRDAYSLLLERAVIRVGLPVKADSEFELAAVDDPNGHASAAQLSLFRRPLPTTNLRFLGAVNWDGRSTLVADPTNVRQSLKNQSNGATVNHAKAAAPIADGVRDAIVDFETSITTAQELTWSAGWLRAQGADGGPDPLLTQPFSIGLNAPGPNFNRNVFSLYDAWADVQDGALGQNRRDVAEGQRIFNTRTFGSTNGTCSGCHDAPNVGGSSSFRLFDVGVSAPSRRSPNVPLYTFRNKTSGETLETTDPGRALISGKWADMNKFKVPGLRALAARAPFFHDGSARDLMAVVNHYDQRFGMGLTYTEKRQLVRFLESL